MTTFVLSPSVETTAASASAMPACSRTVVSMPWPTTKPPRQPGSSRTSASSLSSTTVTSQPSAARPFATAEPTRPQPMTTAFTAACTSSYSSNTPSGNATTRTSHGARRRTKSTVGEKKRDWRLQRGDEPSTIEIRLRATSPRRRSRGRSIEPERRPSAPRLRDPRRAAAPPRARRRLERATSGGSAPRAGTGAARARP